MVIYWVTAKSSGHHGRAPTDPEFASRSKSDDPEPSGTEPSSRASRVLYKLGHSKKASPVGVTSMQVISVRNFLSRSDIELPLLQIRVTTERIDEHGESSANESEYELQKVPTIPQTNPNEVREENRFPDSNK